MLLDSRYRPVGPFHPENQGLQPLVCWVYPGNYRNEIHSTLQCILQWQRNETNTRINRINLLRQRMHGKQTQIMHVSGLILLPVAT